MAGPQYTDREQNAKAPPVSSPTEAEASSEQLLRYLLQLQTGEVDASDSDPVAIQAPIEAVAELDPDTTEQEFSFASEGGGSLPVKDVGPDRRLRDDLRVARQPRRAQYRVGPGH